MTGEYPPARGGVASYVEAVAKALARAGATVHVWSPAVGGDRREPEGVVVHELPGFGARGLRALSRGLAAAGGPRRLLVEYVPHAFGMKAMNVPFCTWLTSRPREEEVWVMLHEVATPWGAGRPLKHDVLGAVTRLMAALVVRRADRLLVSVPVWSDILRSFYPWAPDATWCPIPSNAPSEVDQARVASARARALGGVSDGPVVGHFGTYGSLVAELLEPTLTRVAEARPDAAFVLVGQGGETFAASWRGRGRASVLAPGSLSLDDVAVHLAACDLVVQPFGDGLSSRRTSAMAPLALGVPVVSNRGPATERGVWDGAAVLVDGNDPDRLAGAVVDLLDAPERRAAIGRLGRALYAERFTMEQTLRTLLA